MINPKCKNCKRKNKCDHKTMVACAYVNAPKLSAEIVAPVMQPLQQNIIRDVGKEREEQIKQILLEQMGVNFLAR